MKKNNVKPRVTFVKMAEVGLSPSLISYFKNLILNIFETVNKCYGKIIRPQPYGLIHVNT